MADGPDGRSGPTTPCRPRRGRRGRRRPDRRATAEPRGPMRSPQALSLGKARLVEQGHLGPTPGQHQGGDAAGGAGAHDQRVEARRAHAAPPGPRRATVRSSHPRRRHERADRRDPNRFAQQLFTPLPERYDRLAEILSMGQNGRWRRAMVDHIVPTVRACPRRGLGHGRGGPSTGRPDPGRWSGVDLTEQMLRQGQHNVGRPDGRPGAAGDRPGRADALRRSDLRRPDLHLSVALRGGPAGHPGRAGPGGETRRGGGEPRVPGPREPVLAVLVVGVHPSRSFRSAGWVTVGRRGSRSGGSSAPTSRPTTGATRWRGRWRRGAGPASSTWGSARMSLGGGLVMWGRRAGD